jgi:hypothetical protein
MMVLKDGSLFHTFYSKIKCIVGKSGKPIINNKIFKNSNYCKARALFEGIA